MLPTYAAGVAKARSGKAEQAQRRARLDQMRRAQRRRERRSTLLVVGSAFVAGAVILGVVGFSIAQRRSGSNAGLNANGSISPPRPTTGKTVTAAAEVDASKTSKIAGVTFYKIPSRTHVAGPVTYSVVPPVGGQHNAAWLNCGIYTQAVPNENAVHDLEHGAVWITYQPSLPATQVTALTKLAKSYGPAGSYVDLSPYPGLGSPVVASAWGVQLKVDSASDPRLKKFIDTYREGSQTPEPGSACTGGVGSPVGTVTPNGAPPGGSPLTPQPAGSSTGP